MTSISGNTTPSPFSRVQNTLQRDIAAGSISSTDGTALSSAISDLGAQLTGGAGGTTASAPTSMKDRVNTLIDGEVSSGKLTSDQASQLKAVFEQAHAHMHGHGHHGGGLGAITGSSSDADGDNDGTSTAATSSTSASATDPVQAVATTAISALESFIQQFQAAVSSNGLYGANGTTGTASSASNPVSLLINTIA